MRFALPLIILALALAALGDSVYLGVIHYTSDPGAQQVAACSFAAGSCDEALRSQQATFLGIPTALLGAAYFGLLVLAGLVRVRTGSWPYPRIMPIVLVMGLAFSGYLIYTMVELDAVCPYCMAAHAANTLIVGAYVVSRLLDTRGSLHVSHESGIL